MFRIFERRLNLFFKYVETELQRLGGTVRIMKVNLNKVILDKFNLFIFILQHTEMQFLIIAQCPIIVLNFFFAGFTP